MIYHAALAAAVVLAAGAAHAVPDSQRVCGITTCDEYPGGYAAFIGDDARDVLNKSKDWHHGYPSGSYAYDDRYRNQYGGSYGGTYGGAGGSGSNVHGVGPGTSGGPAAVGPDGKVIGDDRRVVGTGGCLIATAAHGTEMVPQVQNLREIRQRVYQSGAGDLMQAVNSFYYSFSPGVADMERSSPAFREAVLAYITPAMGILSAVDHGGLGGAGLGAYLAGSAHAMIGLYVGLPALAIAGARSMRGRE